MGTGLEVQNRSTQIGVGKGTGGEKCITFVVREKTDILLEKKMERAGQKVSLTTPKRAWRRKHSIPNTAGEKCIAPTINVDRRLARKTHHSETRMIRSWQIASLRKRGGEKSVSRITPNSSFQKHIGGETEKLGENNIIVPGISKAAKSIKIVSM